MSTLHPNCRVLLGLSLIIVFAFSQCGTDVQAESPVAPSPTEKRSAPQDKQRPATPIRSDLTYVSPDDVLVLEELTVISESGLTYRDSPSIEGVRLGSFDLNSTVEVISRTGKKFSVQSDGETIEGEWLGLRYPDQEHDYIVYAFSGFLSASTGSPSGYGWNSILDLHNDEYRELDAGTGGVLTVIEISKERYLTLLSDSTSYLDRSRRIKKVKNSMSLHLAKGDTIVNDIDPEGYTDSPLTHHYAGEVAGISAYLLQRNAFELHDYVAIDTESGREKGSYSQLPRFSPTYDRAISIYNDPYNETGDVSLYSIDADGVASRDTLMAYTHWAPVFDDAIHWLSEHRIVCKAIPRDAKWSATHDEDEFLYLELMLK